MLATNGYKIAASAEYTMELHKSGVSVIYLSFDGVSDKSNREKKNHLIIDKLFENCRKANGLNVMLVPAAIKGVNDDEAYSIIKLAADNCDVVRGGRLQVMEQSIKHLSAVLSMSSQLPVEIPIYALV